VRARSLLLFSGEAQSGGGTFDPRQARAIPADDEGVDHSTGAKKVSCLTLNSRRQVLQMIFSEFQKRCGEMTATGIGSSQQRALRDDATNAACENAVCMGLEELIANVVHLDARKPVLNDIADCLPPSSLFFGGLLGSALGTFSDWLLASAWARMEYWNPPLVHLLVA
jgi:hypothetical protein